MTRKAPQDCATMDALRVQIDALDRDLVALLTARAGYIDRAVTLKKQENLHARITPRVEEVIRNVRTAAQGDDLDPDLVEKLWRDLIDWSIAREAKHIPEN